MNDQSQLYSSRITKNYLEYLDKFYPDTDVTKVLQSSGITHQEVEDPGHWFTQQQVDRFQEALIRETDNHNISHDVGRYLASSEGLGPFRQYMLGLLNPMAIYLLMGKVYTMMSRGAILETQKIGNSAVEIISTPKSGVKEKPYQCDNRIGSFEAVSRLFTKGFAKIEHPSCFHRGDEACHYIISWEKMPSVLWRRVRNGFLLVTLFTLIPLYFLYPALPWSHIVISVAFANLLFFMLSQQVEKKELIKTIETQGNAAEDLLEEMNIRYNNAVLIQEIGQVTSTTLHIHTLLNEVIAIIQKRLDFDRGIVMLVNDQNTSLHFNAGFGYNGVHLKLLKKTKFSLNKPESKGTFAVAFKEQKPILVNNISEIKDDLSEKSLAFARQMGVQSLICVPLIYENESLGILAVDNVKSKRLATKSDMSLLMGVASHTAVGIVHARSFQKLQESEKKYRDLVENSNSIIMRRDINGTITFFNEFAQELFGYNKKEIIGENMVGTILPDAEAATNEVAGLVVSLQQNPEKRVVSEGRNVLRNGDTVWVAWTYKPVFGDDGTLQEILCIGNDITELKQAEAQKADLESRLQRAQKMEAVGTLAGGVAHDLNNILSGIVSYPELILMGLPDNSPLQKPVLTMQKSGEKAAAIVQDLLTLARRGVVSKSVINLNEIISEYLKSPEFEYLKTNNPKIGVKTQFEVNLLNISGSPVHLSKTVMNLIVNATEAMPEGGDVSITTKNRYIDKSFRGFDEVAKGDYVTLIISDNGIGIPLGDIDRIFEPFYTKKVMGRSGTGLGMAVVWGTVKDHDGYIDIQSTVGKGTKFSLYFPVTRAEITRGKEQIPLGDLKGNGESILIVDDSGDQREIATGILEKLGYSVSSVSSGEAAIGHLKSRHVDLLVLDMIMDPGIDGYETYKQILETSPGQKAIIASGFSETKRVKAAQKLGAGAYIKKPYLIEKIGRVVKEEMNRKGIV
jgi:PAS domain S-box-containing protein